MTDDALNVLIAFSTKSRAKTLAYIYRNPHADVTDIANDLNLIKNTVQAHLSAFWKKGYVKRTKNKDTELYEYWIANELVEDILDTVYWYIE